MPHPCRASATHRPLPFWAGAGTGLVLVVGLGFLLSGCGSTSHTLRITATAPAPEGDRPAASCTLEDDFSASTFLKNITVAASDPAGRSFAYGSQVDPAASQLIGVLGSAIGIIGAAKGVPSPAARQAAAAPDLGGCVPVIARSPAVANPAEPPVREPTPSAFAPGRHAGRDGKVRYLDAAWGDTVWYRHADGSRHVLTAGQWLARVS